MPGNGTKAGPRYGDLVQQYIQLRDQHPGVILLFRVGSFYEVLFDDAELVARELGLKLGDRPSGGSAEPVPQCGFAHHALEHFLPRLLRLGYRVAVCEEGEDDGGAVRKRAVVRTLTPGTITDPRLLREDRPSYLAALVPAGDRLGLAWTDLAGGEFKAGEFDLDDAAAELQRLDPAEILVPSDHPAPEGLLARRTVTEVGPSAGAEQTLRQSFPETTLDDLPLAQLAGGVVLRYLDETQGTDVPRLESLQPAGAGDSMRLDATTQRHLEIVETENTRDLRGSLLGTIDRTLTPMGRRMLRSWLLRPLTQQNKIAVRHRLVVELVENEPLRVALASELSTLADLERLAGRAASRQATVDELRALAGVVQQLPSLAQSVSSARSPFLRALGSRRTELAGFAQRAGEILADPESECPVRPEVSPALAGALARLRGAGDWQQQYLNQLRREPGLSKIKLERSSTQGLYLEVPLNSAVPEDWVRRGAVQRAERYTTPALETHAVELADAEALVVTETRAVLTGLRASAAAIAAEARDLAKHLAAADAVLSLAIIAVERGWTLPEMTDGGILSIEEGRHPVLETLGGFQPNDAHLEARGERDQLVVLTGPNMAGKSTWMRQTALIVLLAQAGSFVPATRAQIGVVDAIFTRIGAVDDLASGRSTFMVEMLETASVLRGATDRSLVLLDEIGRGTSTHDGMAIAWAVIEYLAIGPVRPRAILATHYHELAALSSIHPQITLLRAAVTEGPDGIVFPHRIEAGAAEQSFGIEVARLAGLPASVLDRAREVADSVEPLSAEIANRLADAGHGKRAAARPRPLRRAG